MKKKIKKGNMELELEAYSSMRIGNLL